MAGSTDLESRLIELETRLSYQEATIETLNQIVTRQQDQVDQLILVCRRLHERLGAPAAAPGSVTAADDVPPHY